MRARSTALLRALTPARPIKVSIVIATYNSDPVGLRRVLTSIEDQTMAAAEIEVVFVDDGSTDGTPSRLRAWAAERPHVVVREIENSGWASRPRNIGTSIAQGEYVLYMDHDDELYPHALQSAYEFGAAHRADVVNAKEARTDGWSWGWSSYDHNVERADPADVEKLIPMTPHKLYRRAFLLEQGITFPEERRALWEDIRVNTMCLARGAHVAVVADTAFYHWVKTTSNTSSSFGRDPEEFFAHLRGLFDLFDTELADRPSRGPLIAHQLRARVLDVVGPKMLTRSPAYVEVMYRRCRGIVERYAPPDHDAEFDAVFRARLELLRAGNLVRQRALARCDDGVTAVPVLDDVHWEGAHLVMRVSTVLVDGHGDPLRLRRVGERWLRDLPADVADTLSAEAVDVTDDLVRARFDVSVKGRDSRTTWRLPDPGHVSCTDDGSGFGIVTAVATARFDPAAFAAERRLEDRVWDFAARFAAMGFGAHRAVRGGETAVALLSGVAAVGYVNQSGYYSLDTGSAVRAVVDSAPPDPAQVLVRVKGGGRDGSVTADVIAPLPAVHCVGASTLTGQALIGDSSSVPAMLLTDDGRAMLRFSGRFAEGRHPIRTQFLGRTGPAGFAVTVRAGEVEVQVAD